MATLKTQPTDKDVSTFIASIENESVQEDCRTLVALMEKHTEAKGVMWGEHIVGFGNYHYKYKSGRSGEWFLIGFSPRKSQLSIYLMDGVKSQNLEELLGPKIKMGKGCLYVKRLSDIDLDGLDRAILTSVQRLKRLDARRQGPKD